MTPERYSKVKEIFLVACEKAGEEQKQFIAAACAGDEEMRREVESLLKEHQSEVQVMPSDPEGPLGPMSAILSRAGIDVGTGRVVEKGDASGVEPLSVVEAGEAVDPSHTPYIEDDAHDQTSGTRSGFVDPGRFPAGSVVAERYRIIELLGRGGMGEVYRADDITLNQSVALKFLPALFGSDAKWLARFRNEVRLSRQVTHPNVCRVFDIGEYKGEQFISMEYVDGENLASLLRRIGRVPHDKAVLLARQLCAGLSAAHERGVLHRDLKPANVMIDGRGAVRITDFGLAAPADQLKSDAIRAGTPAYMSPEQLRGKAVSVRSDVYSLGLVLYEMFTGRRAFRAENLHDYKRMHSSEEPTPPSEIVEDIDPIVDRVIMRCLEKDPKDRPASAMAVSAALPGGNPLREILAAGEIPSPEVVAAAGEAGGVMKPRLAWMLLLTALACMIGFIYMAPRVFVVQQAIRDPHSDPAWLTLKAQEILNNLGYNEALKNPSLAPRDRASGFALNYAYYNFVENNQTGRDRLWRLWRSRMGLVYFWYRQSPELLVPLRSEGTVAERDPPPGVPGMATVRLDPLGRLVRLEYVPATPTESKKAGTAEGSAPLVEPVVRPDWTPLLEAAGLNMEKDDLKEIVPLGSSPVYADTRIAWNVHFSDSLTLRQELVRVEAAALNGRPVFFAVIGTWENDELSQNKALIKSEGRFNQILQTAVIAALLVVGTFLAWKNHRSGRGDRVGALRMALAFFLLGVIAWLFSAHHVPDPVSEFELFNRGMGPVLYSVCLMWVFYMALEPYVRRIWPETVISWSRLLSGKWLDPLVGRDVLAGAAVGVMTTLLSLVEYQIPQWLGEIVMPVPLPLIQSATQMLSATRSLGPLFSTGIVALYSGLMLLLCLVLVRMLIKLRWMATTLAVVLFAVATAHYRVEEPWRLGWENLMSLGIQALLALVMLAVLTRHGLVALIFCLLVRALMLDFPVTWNLSAWYTNASMAGIVPTIIMLTAGFYAALGGRSLLNLRSEK
jgi:serine/threonine-protein kinase